MHTHLSLARSSPKRCAKGSRSTRIEDAQDNLIALVNDVAFEFSFDPSQIATLWVSVSGGSRSAPDPPLALDRPAAPVGHAAPASARRSRC